MGVLPTHVHSSNVRSSASAALVLPPPRKRSGSVTVARLALLGVTVCLLLLVLSVFLVDVPGDGDDLESESGLGGSGEGSASHSRLASTSDHVVTLDHVREKKPSPAVPHPSHSEKSSGSGADLRRHASATTTANPHAKPPVVTPYGANQALRVFVYDDLPHALGADLRTNANCGGRRGVSASGYADAEWLIPELVAKSDVYTPHAELADFYLVPALTECFVAHALEKGLGYQQSIAALNRHFRAVLDHVQSKYPYWSRTEGRDHVFVFPAERGPNRLRADVLSRLRKSVLLVGSGYRDRTVVDQAHGLSMIAIPPATLQHGHHGADEKTKADFDPSSGAVARNVLLSFRGPVPGVDSNVPTVAPGTAGAAAVSGASMSLGPRYVLWRNLRDEEGVHFVGYEPGDGNAARSCNRTCAVRELGEAEYCLVPDGVEGWTLRLYESLGRGCVPVIIADGAELPFERFLDWSEFSRKVHTINAADVADTLRTSGRAKLKTKQAAIAMGRAALTYHRDEVYVEGDAFAMLLRELKVRVRFFRNSPYRFFQRASVTSMG
ncbi:glucuronoxylan glucuronosyltransferase [Pycnococcus provasolii]